MKPVTLIPKGFDSIVDCDYVVKQGCLFLLCNSIEHADNICNDRDRLKRWLLNRDIPIDGVFIDFRDGSRVYAFKVGNRPPLPMRYPFQVNDKMSLSDIIALGRVSPCVTWVYELDEALEGKLIYSNQDEDGLTTERWNPEPIQVSGAVAGIKTWVQHWHWRGQDYRLIQYNSVG